MLKNDVTSWVKYVMARPLGFRFEDEQLYEMDTSPLKLARYVKKTRAKDRMIERKHVNAL